MFRIVTLVFLAAALALGQPAGIAAKVDALATAALAESKSPGLAIGVITREGGFAKGYGVRHVEKRQPVTEHTAFDTGSVTKSFTALGAALMVDEGKLEWDKPVREYLPWFRMYDPVATELMTVRDLLTHRSGLPRYDLIRFAVPLPREELVRRLRYLPPTASFRERYQYQNLMYTAAGFLAGAVDGSSWEELTERRIFIPLGMRDSTTRVTDMQKREDFAWPHESENGAIKPVEFYDYQKFGVGPNGAVNSSASDMLRYLKFLMGDGTFEGKRLISRGNLAALQAPQMVVGEKVSYGLGWEVNWARGFKVVSHGGAITGFRAFAVFAPERGEAVVVLANSPANPAQVAGRILEGVLGWPKEPETPRVRAEDRPGIRAAPVNGPPSRPLSAYAGRYFHPAFGNCEIVEQSGKLVAKFPELSIALQHVRFDLFGGAQQAEVQFLLDRNGEPGAMNMRVDPAAPPLRFERR